MVEFSRGGMAAGSVISSPLMTSDYTRAVPDHQAYIAQLASPQESPMARKTYQRNAARRLINAISGTVVRLGMSSRTGVITTTGRSSGEPRSTPVDLISADGHLHVVGIYGAKAWVLNLRANPACTIRARDGETAYSAVELSAAAGSPVLRAYLEGSKLVRDYQDVGPDASPEAMELAAADRPVFRLDPAA